MFPRGCGEKRRASACSRPNEYLLALFQQLWRELGGTFHGRRARRHWCPSGAPARHLGIAAARRGDPRHQQVQQQRDGAAAVPHALARPRPIRRPPRRKPRAPCGSGSLRSHLDFPELSWRTAPACRATSASAPRHLGELLPYAWRSPLMPEYAGVAAHSRRGRHFAPPPGRFARGRAGAHQDRLSGGRARDRRLRCRRSRAHLRRRQLINRSARDQCAELPGRGDRVGYGPGGAAGALLQR